MAYTTTNYRTKQALVDAFMSGREVGAYQPGGMFDLRDGETCLEGPHYPEPHRWYCEARTVGGTVVALKVRGKWVARPTADEGKAYLAANAERMAKAKAKAQRANLNKQLRGWW